MTDHEGSREKGVGGREWGVGGDSAPHSPLPTRYSPEPTPAQLAYAAYQAALPERAYFPAPAWTLLDVAYHRAWDAAAQAVLKVEPEARALLYVVVLQEGAQMQLCGAYPNADEAGIHLVHARTLMPDRLFEVRVCPFALTGGVHRQEAPDV